jgi:hypothetical protein
MTRRVYMTARCPLGCEWWAPPEVMARHVDSQRCPRRAWYRTVRDEVLVERDDAERLTALGAGHLLRLDAARDQDPASHYLRGAIREGAALHSPMPHIPARVWWKVVRAHLDDEGRAAVVARAMTPEGFAELMPSGLLESCRPCPECGAQVLNRMQHQRSNSRCRCCVPANRVREYWSAGYRDPWTIIGGAPLTWSALQAASWRKNLVVVEFLNWNAVLVRSPRVGSA